MPEAVGECLHMAQHMGDLIESLLELAKMDAESVVLHKEILHLGEMVEEVGAMIEPIAVQKGLEVNVDACDAELMADPVRLKQILMNLMANAVQHMESGGLRVHFAQEAESVVVHVTDTGAGIESDQLQLIFDRFYRGNVAREKPQENNGLGLSIAQELVEAHGGEIWVESELGIGSTFSFRLPTGMLFEEESILLVQSVGDQNIT